MKRWKKFLLFLVALVLVSQIPFAYRRYKLGRLHAVIQQLNSQRLPIEKAGSNEVELKGVIHVHSFLGGHSTGNFEEIINAAKSNQLDFVVMTEHPSSKFNTSEMTLKGVHDGVLFVNGNEVRSGSGDRFLLLPGDLEAATDNQRSTAELLARRTAGLTIVTYPEEFKSWESQDYGGIEVYNVFTNAREINPLVMFFDGLWSYRSYPDLLFASFYRRPSDNLKRWDEQIRQHGRSLVATAGNDAHANIGLNLNDASGNTLIGFKLDPYERSFRLVRLHVFVPSSLSGELNLPLPDEAGLLRSISGGHCFIGFDLFGDTTGFRFTAEDADEKRTMGDEIKLADQVLLTATVPIAGRIVLLKDGAIAQESSAANRMEFIAREKGSYRVEVYLPQLQKSVGDQPWIISNPIYVR